jgi:hypothetical protein
MSPPTLQRPLGSPRHLLSEADRLRVSTDPNEKEVLAGRSSSPTETLHALESVIDRTGGPSPGPAWKNPTAAPWQAIITPVVTALDTADK